MTKEQKEAAVEQIGQWLGECDTIYLTDYSGLSVEDTQELRTEFRNAGVDYRVLKNTLVKLAMDKAGGFEDIVAYLSGPTAVAFTNNPSAPAKVIKKFTSGDKEKPALKAAYIDGAIFDGTQLAELAALKSKEELIADILGLLTSPLTNVVSALQGQGSTLVGAIKEIGARAEA